MEDERTRLGQLFREKREEKGETIKEIENETSIRSSYLEAIEAGIANDALSPVYINGFTRQYATYLGFQLEQLADRFPTVFNTGAEKHDFAYGIGTLEMRGSSNGGVRWLPNLMWAGVSALLIVGAWFFAKLLGVF